MKKTLLALVAVMFYSLGVLLSPQLQAQDLTTMLSKFLVDLRAGTLGVNQPVSKVLVGAGGASLPSLSFSTATSTGVYLNGTGSVGLAASGALIGTVWNDATHGFQLSSAIPLSWGTQNATPDLQLTRAAAGQFGWTAVLFANLGTTANGSFCYCSDCTIASPCAGGGTGALAKRLNGVWVCN